MDASDTVNYVPSSGDAEIDRLRAAMPMTLPSKELEHGYAVADNGYATINIS